jgi:putative transposase
MSMETLYEIAGISRQAFHDWKQPSSAALTQTAPQTVLEMAQDVRSRFLPGCSARAVYHFIRKRCDEYNKTLKGWGKHRFEALCLQNGFRIEYKRFVPKTTQRGGIMFKNKIEGMVLNDINQLWASDIAYIVGTNGKLIGYSTTLFDVYSRYLLGLSFSQTMHAKNTSIPVLQQAFKERNLSTFPNLIFHSDGGKQYIEKHFLDMLGEKKIDSSMAHCCYENPHAEALNDILKNHLLPGFNLNSFQQLKNQEQFVKLVFNQNKSHSGIGNVTPAEFERELVNLQPYQRTKLLIKSID